MLLATTILLLVFRSPSATISVMWLISAKMFINEKPPFPLRKFHSIANLCATLNAATTFIMFIIYGTKFRSEFTRIYCCCWYKRTKRNTVILIKPEEQQCQQIRSNPLHDLNSTLRESRNTTRTTNVSLLSMRGRSSNIEQDENLFDRVKNYQIAIPEDEEEEEEETKSKTMNFSLADWMMNIFKCR